MTTPITMENSNDNNDKKKKNRKPIPLPPSWTKIMSDRGPYYWNKETNFTQWKFPREEGMSTHMIYMYYYYLSCC